MLRFSLSNKLTFITLILSIIFLAGGCSPKRTYKPEDETLFIPPTLVPTAIPTRPSTALPNTSSSQEEADCVDQLSFSQDLTVPDNTPVKPGSTIDKRWEVKNDGTCNWDEKYRLKFIDGNEMNAPVEQSLYPALSNHLAPIRVVFTAPEEPGIYRTDWQAYNAQGEPFGDLLYMVIEVVDEGTDSGDTTTDQQNESPSESTPDADVEMNTVTVTGTGSDSTTTTQGDTETSETNQ